MAWLCGQAALIQGKNNLKHVKTNQKRKSLTGKRLFRNLAVA